VFFKLPYTPARAMQFGKCLVSIVLSFVAEMQDRAKAILAVRGSPRVGVGLCCRRLG
jgi:hypothetical protein